MRTIYDRTVRVLGSYGLSVTCLLFLALLTWLGTLEQVNSGLHEVQKKYFESIFLIHWAGPIPVPLPGAYLVMLVLAVNLAVGGIVRLRRTWSRVGILIIHLGMAFLLLSGFVKFYFSQDGHLTLYEGQSGNRFESYYRWELAIAEDKGDGRLLEHVVPQEDFVGATGTTPAVLTTPELPFDLQITRFVKNSRPMPKGPMFTVDVPVIDGAFLKQVPTVPTAEQNIAGCYAKAVDRATGESQEAILWGLARDPWTVTFGGRRWAINLRHQRYDMPFAVTLDKFTKEDHPRTNMPSKFASDVTIAGDGDTRAVNIHMNHPLRSGGLVVFQASWGPSNARPGDPLFSTFAVVRNPADQYPLYACIVIAVGLLVHFLYKLYKYVRSEMVH